MNGWSKTFSKPDPPVASGNAAPQGIRFWLALPSGQLLFCAILLWPIRPSQSTFGSYPTTLGYILCLAARMDPGWRGGLGLACGYMASSRNSLLVDRGTRSRWMGCVPAKSVCSENNLDRDGSRVFAHGRWNYSFGGLRVRCGSGSARFDLPTSCPLLGAVDLSGQHLGFREGCSVALTKTLAADQFTSPGQALS
jgi:hypothetical protein